MRPRPRRAMRAPMRLRAARVIVPALAVGALGSGVAVLAWPSSGAEVAVPAPLSTQTAPAASAPVSSTQPADRTDRTNRDLVRPALAPSPADTVDLDAVATAVEHAEDRAELVVTGTKYVTDELNVRTTAKEKAKVVETLEPGSKVKVTKTVRSGFRLIENDGDARWVKNAYLSSDKPELSDVTMKPCGLGSGMEAGLTKDAILVHRTVCARYPQVTSYGGRGGGGYHASGRAVDCMISNSTVGWELARWVRAHASELGVSEVIFEQKIWTVQRSGEGWRPMADRGSVSANHYNHVHVSVYGNAATG